MAFEKVSPQHVDKIADRIAGAIVDHCYTHSEGGWLKSNPRVAVEVLLGHGKCYVMIETSCTRAELSCNDVDDIVHRIVGDVEIFVTICDQDPELSKNQKDGIKAADNGIFKGCPPTVGFESPAKRGTAIKQGANNEKQILTDLAAYIYERIPYDGKYVIGDYKRNMAYKQDDPRGHMIVPSVKGSKSHAITICQSHATYDELLRLWFEFWEKRGGEKWGPHVVTIGKGANKHYYSPFINPLGPWTGGINVDCGAVNRKLGSDMGDGVSGGGINGKDLSKGDVSINIVCFLKAVQSGQTVTACCSIGDEYVTFQYADGTQETERFADIVEQARLYILTDCGGSFERFAEWGLIRPLDV